ncbi:hypothetical protein CSAL01_07903 [Colletotrichum salicis]|uniref:C6 zinc finger protein n=1 Tax=Colletotrichum salicis TaxID=1209931 RepID=A0A135UN22_9PEZI|nr:hypothetical protein CSAL01_07903 [Colletotrichum salicis]
MPTPGPVNGGGIGGLGLGNGGGGGGIDDLSLNLIDLELMHNFTTFAFNTLSTDPVVRQMWKVPVVRLALECDYVMRALLSVSALHLAHNRPERRDFFISRALTYHQMASWTAMGLMGALDGENCEMLYLFSVLTIFFALACPRKSSDSLIMGESSFPDWLFLLRGTRSLLKELDPHTYAGPLTPMFNHGRERYMHTRDESKIQSDLLADLQRLVNKTCADAALLPVYNRAIDELRRTLSVFLWDAERYDVILTILKRVIRKVDKAWVDTLAKSDKRGSNDWPHAQDEGYNKYRLNDHVWIWRALRLIEDDRLRSSETIDHPDDGDLDREEVAEGDTKYQRTIGMDQRDQSFSNDKKTSRKFDSGVVQRDILRRFTVENDVSKKWMLAMTRSPRETRFLLHASDTALFYRIEWNFFLQTLFDEVWDSTIEAQVHHSENSETGLDNSIRYALAIMMGTRNMALNKRLTNDLVKSSFGVLIRSANPNGLFCGQLDGTTKEPALFTREEDWDFYFLASFEIPSVLLTHHQEIDSAHKNIHDKDTESPPGLEKSQLTPHCLLEEVADMIAQ